MGKHEEQTNAYQAAVRDMLLFLRYPRRGIRSGRQLGPTLLPVGWEDADESILAARFREVLLDEMRARRRAASIDDVDTMPREERLRRHFKSSDPALALLGVVWANYIDGMSTSQIAAVESSSTRAIQYKLAQGRTEVAKIFAGRTVSPASSPHPKHGREPEQRATHASPQQHRNRRLVLERVRNFWIKGVLEASLYSGMAFQLDLRARPEAVRHPWDAWVQRPFSSADLFDPEMQIVEAFDSMGEFLLVLGAPGAGKTVALLELGRELLDRAEEDGQHPIPVILTLASWSTQHASIATWMVEELSVRYGVASKLAQAWMKSGQILPLLDGLDEVDPERRAACVQALNMARRDPGLPGLVVCCRSADYVTIGIQLELEGAVEIQPLTPEQIHAHLRRLGNQVKDVETALHADTELEHLARTPLMFHLLLHIYQGSAVEEHHDPGTRRTWVLTTYIQHMLRRRRSVSRYTEAHMLRWLAWLGYAMERYNQGLFHLERIQPEWLPSADQHRQYLCRAGLLRGSIVGMVCGMVVALSVLVAVVLGMLPFDVRLTPASVVVIVLISGGIFGVSYGLIGRSAAKRTPSDHIQIVETLSWTTATARVALGTGFIAGSIGGILASWVYGMETGLMYGAASGATLGLLILVRGTTGMEIEERISPNQGIRRSAYNALLTGGSVGLASGAFFELLVRLIHGTGFEYVFGPLFGLALGTLIALFYGGEAVVKHYLLRLSLFRSGVMPWTYVDFLNVAAERLLLRKVGGGYMFLHPSFQAYFADQYADDRRQSAANAQAEPDHTRPPHSMDEPA